MTADARAQANGYWGCRWMETSAPAKAKGVAAAAAERFRSVEIMSFPPVRNLATSGSGIAR